MKRFSPPRIALTALFIILLMFVIVSFFDIAISVLSSRFYSNAAFITIFGVGGVFAGLFAYMQTA